MGFREYLALFVAFSRNIGLLAYIYPVSVLITTPSTLQSLRERARQPFLLVPFLKICEILIETNRDERKSVGTGLVM